MLWTFGMLWGVMALITLWRPLAEPREFPVRHEMDSKTSPMVCVCGLGIIAIVLAIFVGFR